MEPEVAYGIVQRELRKQRALSQEFLAHESGLERHYISPLELGRNSTSFNSDFRTIDLKFEVLECLRTGTSQLKNACPKADVQA